MSRRAILVFVASMGASGFLALSQGPGESAPGGLPGYEGSELCISCHPGPHDTWATSLHARTVHRPTEREEELLSRSILCGEHEAKYVLGEAHARRFMVDSEQEAGMHVLLPCRYDVGQAEWSHLHEDDWHSLTWEKSCGACHTTGFSSDDFSFREMRVGCEACHGPGIRHGGFKSAGKMIRFGSISASEEVAVCASCHLQGGISRKTGLNYASNYRAGEDLFSDYSFDWKSLDAVSEDTENPIDIHQKLLIRDVVAGKSGAGLRCTSCHSIHATGNERQAKHEALGKQEYCHLCHTRESFELKEYNQACNVCEF